MLVYYEIFIDYRVMLLALMLCCIPIEHLAEGLAAKWSVRLNPSCLDLGVPLDLASSLMCQLLLHIL